MIHTLIQPPDLAATVSTDELTQRLLSTLDIEPVRTADGEFGLPQGSLKSGEIVGPYRILQFIAAGGMAEVYAAQRKNESGTLSIPVALKVISDNGADRWSLIQRFKREAMIIQAIQSPHVVSIYEYGELDNQQSFLAMELLQGEELFDKLHRENTISPLELAELTVQILNGLADIHEAGFIHRDIKPENIYLVRVPGKSAPQVKILDFGIAKVLSEQSDPKLSVAGQIYGTPQYLAPEQANSPDVDPRADIYSLGVVLYECISGSRPFDNESTYAVVHAHQNQPVPPLPSYIDIELSHIILQALNKDPEERFQSAREMAMVMQQWIDESSWAEEFRNAEQTTFFVPPTHQAADNDSDDSIELARTLTDQIELIAATSPTPTTFAQPELRLASRIPRANPATLPAPRIEVDMSARQRPQPRDPAYLARPPWEEHPGAGSGFGTAITWIAALGLIASIIWAFFI